MVDVLRIKRRAVGGAVGPPATLAAAEIAFNEQDRTLYYGLGNSGGLATSIISIGGSGAYLPLTGGALSGGLSFGSVVAPGGVTDLTRHISLWSTSFGFNVTGNRLNYVVPGAASHIFVTSAGDSLAITSTAKVGIKTLTPQADLHIGTAAGTSRVYNVYTNATNGEWSYAGDWGGTFLGTATYGSDQNGTGVLNDVNFVRAGVEFIRLAPATVTLSVGMNFGSTLATSTADLTRHISLWGTAYGFSVTSGRLNYIGGTHRFLVGGGAIDNLSITSAGISIGGATSGSVTLAVPAVASGTITLPAGTTNFSTTGGAGRVVKQLTSGGAFTVAAVTTNEIDVTQPLPTLLGTATISGSTARGVAIMGDYAYTTGNAVSPTHALEIFDISDSTAPDKIGGIDLPAQPLGNPIVAGELLYVGCNIATNNLQIFDIRNPNALALLSQSTFGNAGIQYIALAGNYLYIGHTGANATWQIADISDPGIPIQKSTTTIVGASGTRTMVLQGKYLFIGTGQAVVGIGGLYIYDISDVVAPSLVNTYDCAVAVSGLAISGRYLYIAGASAAHGLEVLDISDPTSLSSLAVVPVTGIPNVASNPIIAGNYLFNTNNSVNGLQVFSLSNPASPSSVGIVSTGATSIGSALRGNRIYVMSGTTFRIYDTLGINITTIKAGSVNTDNIYVDGQSNFNGDILAQRGLTVGLPGIFSRGPIVSDASEAAIPISAMFGNGLIIIGTNQVTSPALKRSAAVLQVRTGTDSAHAPLEASTISAGGNAILSTGASLEVSGASTTVYAQNAAATGIRMAVTNTDTTDGNFSRILFPSFNSTPVITNMGAITFIHTTHLAGSEASAFTIQGRLAGVYAERLRLAGNNLGVGSNFATNAPQALLHVGATAATARTYNLFTNTLNGTWCYLGDWSKTSNVATFGTDQNGTGPVRNIQLVVGGTNQLDFGVTNANAWTMAQAMKISSSVGATDFATLNVDAVSTVNAAKFGPTLPVYMITSDPTVGFNAYINTGSSYAFGKGSVAGSHYCGALSFQSSTGQFILMSSTATGAANAAATMKATLQVDKDGAAYITSHLAIGFGIGTPAASAISLNVFTDFNNYEFAYMGDWNRIANVASYGTDKIGSGAVRDAQFVRGGVVQTYYESTGVRIGDSIKFTVGNLGGVANSATAFGIRLSGSNIGTTAGSYLYPVEYQYFATNVIRLQTAAYRRYAGTSWQGTSHRIQYAVDNSFTDGSRAYCELGADGAGNGYVVLGTQGNSTLMVQPTGLVSFGGVTNAFPALKPTGALLETRLADNSGPAGLTAATPLINDNSTRVATTAFVRNQLVSAPRAFATAATSGSTGAIGDWLPTANLIGAPALAGGYGYALIPGYEYYSPFLCPITGLVTGLAAYITGVGTNLLIGIYDVGANGLPGQCISRTAAINVTTVGLHGDGIPAAWTPTAGPLQLRYGWFYIGILVPNGGTSCTIAATSRASIVGPTPLGVYDVYGWGSLCYRLGSGASSTLPVGVPVGNYGDAEGGSMNVLTLVMAFQNT